jgi:SHS2 domain-containing protein
VSAGWELVDHTADVMVRAFGASREEVFEQAALATVSLIYDATAVRAAARHAVELGAPDEELLLAAWLNELLFLIEARHVVFARFEVESVGPEGAGAESAGAAGGTSGREEAAAAERQTAAASPAVMLRATAVGEAFDGRRHAVRSVVKAATLHGLSLREVPGGWEGRVLLDV